MTENYFHFKLKNQKNKAIKILVRICIAIFLLANFISYFHAYKFTHFSDSSTEKTKAAGGLSFGKKLSVLFFGVNNPRPKNEDNPNRPYSVVKLQSNVEIDCWSIKVEPSKGTVILFHGYGSNKSSLLEKSNILNSLGYSTFLVDFMGSGASEGNTTTIGYKEAQQVASSFDYVKETGEENIILAGSSMGAVAIMKAMDDYHLKPSGLLLECPFGSMRKTVKARFDVMNIPSFPMADLLMFWGGVQNGFWAYNHQPTEYAKTIDSPTLLMYGEQDRKVSRGEIDEIFTNIDTQKKLVTFPEAGHDNYLLENGEQWKAEVKNFLMNLN